jgi:hypothetical protein
MAPAASSSSRYPRARSWYDEGPHGVFRLAVHRYDDTDSRCRGRVKATYPSRSSSCASWALDSAMNSSSAATEQPRSCGRSAASPRSG